MRVERRAQGKKTKYYLEHAFRVGNAVKKARRYLGSDLTEKQLKSILPQAKLLLQKQIEESKNPLLHDLSKEELAAFQKFDARIKIEHLNDAQWERFTRDFTYHTNAIEGSTVSKEDVNSLIDKNIRPKDDEEQEAVNVASAIEFIRKTNKPLTPGLMNTLHRICFNETKHHAGTLRTVHVVIKDAKGTIVHEGAEPEEIKNLLTELCSWYTKNEKKLPILVLASVLHNQFEKIHPYQDGNGRVGRLLLNYALLKHSHPPINVKVRDRNEYYHCLRSYDKTGDIKPTIKFIIKQYATFSDTRI